YNGLLFDRLPIISSSVCSIQHSSVISQAVATLCVICFVKRSKLFDHLFAKIIIDLLQRYNYLLRSRVYGFSFTKSVPGISWFSFFKTVILLMTPARRSFSASFMSKLIPYMNVSPFPSFFHLIFPSIAKDSSISMRENLSL